MLHRIEMHIIHMVTKVPVVANRVLPEPSLPNATLAA